ncbi:MAG TPA: ABC transporter permease [Thermoplasmata archaeon]|nr:ABC transporter permease [Thermoplasmata archaeon]
MSADGPPSSGTRRPPVVPIVAGLLSASLIALFVLPLAALFADAGASGLVAAAGDRAFQTSVEFTLLASGVAVGLGVVTGVPLGYLLARYRFPGRSAVESIVLVPVVIPHLVVGLALLLLLAPTAPLGVAVARLGIPVFDATAGVILVMLYVGASYVVLSSEIAFRSVDEELLESARSLGASPTEAFLSVTLPSAARGIVTGALLMWARGVSEVGGFLILAYAVAPSFPWSGPVTNTASVFIFDYYGIAPSAAVGFASVLVLISLAIFLGVRFLDRSGLAWARGGWFS